jgi:hypothetical protein
MSSSFLKFFKNIEMQKKTAEKPPQTTGYRSFSPRFSAAGKWAGEVNAVNGGAPKAR